MVKAIIDNIQKETRNLKKDCVSCFWGYLEEAKFGVKCNHIKLQTIQPKSNLFVSIKQIQNNGIPDWCPYKNAETKSGVNKYFLFKCRYRTTPTIK